MKNKKPYLRLFKRNFLLTNETTIESCVALISSILPRGSKGVYVSTPITSGRQLLQSSLVLGEQYAYGSPKYWEIIQKEVIPINCSKGNAFAEKVRIQTDRVVIDPSMFFHCEWTQEDYLFFWQQVIEKYVQEIWFNEYWYFSSGCVFEYSIALGAGISCKDHLGLPILKKEALSFIMSAIEILNKKNLAINRLQEVYQRLATDEAC